MSPVFLNRRDRVNALSNAELFEALEESARDEGQVAGDDERARRSTTGERRVDAAERAAPQMNVSDDFEAVRRRVVPRTDEAHA